MCPLPCAPSSCRRRWPASARWGCAASMSPCRTSRPCLPLVDELTPEARAIGAVNTVAGADDRSLGHNTDAEGFLRALREAGFAAGGLHGAGAGRGRRGARRGLCAGQRRRAGDDPQPHRRARRGAGRASSPRWSDGAAVAAGALDRVALAAPRGAQPNWWSTPPRWACGRTWRPRPGPTRCPFPPRRSAYDLVYNPRETRLMAAGPRGGRARRRWAGDAGPSGRRGLSAVDGRRAARGRDAGRLRGTPWEEA